MIDRGPIGQLVPTQSARSRGAVRPDRSFRVLHRPIALRNPIVFYEGHLPAFSVISLQARARARRVNARLEQLFERGIDPDSDRRRPAQRRVDGLALARRGAGVRRARRRPGRRRARRARRSRRACTPGNAPRGRPSTRRSSTRRCTRRRSSTCGTACRYEQKHRPAGPSRAQIGDRAADMRASVRIPAGRATLGAARAIGAFGWDNEFEAHQVDVPASRSTCTA